jgi:hypothetical protein
VAPSGECPEDASQEGGVDDKREPIRLEDIVTEDDYRALHEIEARVVAECAALRHTRLGGEFHEVE